MNGKCFVHLIWTLITEKEVRKKSSVSFKMIFMRGRSHPRSALDCTVNFSKYVSLQKNRLRSCPIIHHNTFRVWKQLPAELYHNTRRCLICHLQFYTVCVSKSDCADGRINISWGIAETEYSQSFYH